MEYKKPSSSNPTPKYPALNSKSNNFYPYSFTNSTGAYDIPEGIYFAVNFMYFSSLLEKSFLTN
jgi:hypothetical protein